MRTNMSNALFGVTAVSSSPRNFSCSGMQLTGSYTFVGLTEDITERKRAQESLKESEQLFRSIFENAQIGINIFDIDTRVHLTNRALQEMLGYRENELGRLEQWDEIVHTDRRCPRCCVMLRSLA